MRARLRTSEECQWLEEFVGRASAVLGQAGHSQQPAVPRPLFGGPREERSSATTRRPPPPPPPRWSREAEERFLAEEEAERQAKKAERKKDDKDDRKKDRDERNDNTKKDYKADRKDRDDGEGSKKKEDKNDRKKGNMKEKQKKDKKKKDDGKKVVDDRKDKPKKGVPQARGTVKKARASPSAKKVVSLGEDLVAMVQRSKDDLSLMEEQKKAAEKELEGTEGQIQVFEEEVAERQTKIKALQLCRTQCLAEVEEKAAAVEKKKQELLETQRLHAKYVHENQASTHTASSVSSEYTYCSYSEEEPEEEPLEKK